MIRPIPDFLHNFLKVCQCIFVAKCEPVRHINGILSYKACVFFWLITENYIIIASLDIQGYKTTSIGCFFNVSIDIKHRLAINSYLTV